MYSMFLSFPTGHGLTGVSQFPRHRVTEKEQAVTLRCDPISGHDTLLWYQHAVGKEMTFLIRFLREFKQDESGMPNNRFSAERTKGTYSTLKIQPAQVEDSGVYFCASSPDTVLLCQALPVQIPPSPLSSRPGAALSPHPSLSFCPKADRRGRTRTNESIARGCGWGRL